MKTYGFHNRLAFILTLFLAPSAAFAQLGVSELNNALAATTSKKEKADICYSISKIHADALKVDSAIFYANKIKELSLPVAYNLGLGKHHLAMAATLFLRQKKTECEENTRKAIAIFLTENNFLFLGMAYRQLAANYDSEREFLLSRKTYWTAIHYSKLSGDDNTLSREYFELARSYHRTFEIDSAAGYYAKAIIHAEKINDRNKIFISSGNLGILFLGLGDLPNAHKYLEYSLRNRLPASNKVSYRTRLLSYAECLILMHEYRKADSVMREYKLLNESLGDKWGEAGAHLLKGNIEYETGNYEQALGYFEKGYRIFAFSEDLFEVKNIMFKMGRTEFQLRRYDSAIVHLKKVVQISRRLKFKLDEMLANELISASFEKMDQPDSAFHYYKNYSDLKDQVLSLDKQKNIIEVTTRYETGKKEQEIKLLQKEGEASSYLIRLKDGQLEKQRLEDEQKSQQLALLSQQNKISDLEASQKALAFENQQKEMVKNQQEMKLLAKENELQMTVAAEEGQRKNFAYIAMAAILFLGASLFYRYTQNKKLSRKLSASLVELKQAQEQLIKTEREKEAENIRSDISRDIHDEVGATLSGVALFSEIARQKIQQDQGTDAQVYLDHITANSKEMIEKMSDIVWTVNPLNDSFERIIAKLQSYAVNLCAGKGIRLHLDIDEAVRAYSPSMQVRKNIYLLLKEAINNAVKYSGCNNIFFSLHKIDDRIIIDLKDDGKGFDHNRIYQGNGLKNIHTRAADLDADLTINSSKESGTLIRLQFDFHPAGGYHEAI